MDNFVSPPYISRTYWSKLFVLSSFTLLSIFRINIDICLLMLHMFCYISLSIAQFYSEIHSVFHSWHQSPMSEFSLEHWNFIDDLPFWNSQRISAPIRALKCNFPPFWETDQPTNRWKGGANGKFISNKNLKHYAKKQHNISKQKILK